MSEYEADKDANTHEFITFLVGSQEFGIDVMSVREIRVWTPATPIAHSPSYVAGVINLRGVVLPIIDFASRLGFGPAQPTSRHAILVAQVNGRSIGLLVEGVSEILTVTSDLIQPLPNLASEITKAFISGIVATQDRMISLIGLDSVLPEDNELAAA